eukprot:CAMPEP_0204145712 /NCGR_PEP_ID=MMETSP0361-20130328/21739_1 /ASSEMBLY_ACC=CAM_ASM_000343 /TAXON_ID=268821 /ORGANISM="Scrippsiella Hangoei, Strain SHTV-5" /LENGTH=80 /DNA_ID=CAMNT_0051099747 /DNA_START=255 /DNA_END=494 /DNA_ORIENTATION=-
MIQSLNCSAAPFGELLSPRPGCTLDPSSTADESCSKPKLLDGILAGQQLRRDDADGREHGEAAVVELPLPHLGVVLAEAG